MVGCKSNFVSEMPRWRSCEGQHEIAINSSLHTDISRGLNLSACLPPLISHPVLPGRPWSP